ncbi:MAG TPA: hypothetical protein VNK23_03695 [Candidatus Dormibacteraeota bacterium]|nr:hypothetical protein [Candidatus Dormibacteraeota bacterium]
MKDDLDPANSDLSPAANPAREIMTDAIRYWEPRRIGYNVVLAAVVIAWIAFSWPHFRPAIKFESIVLLAVLAMWANICYCAAYLIDFPMQFSFFRSGWQRWRWGLWTFGMMFAVLVANYWIADEIFPYVR